MVSTGERRGLSFVEVLVATVVVAVTIIAYLSLAIREVGWTRDVGDRAKALDLAHNMLVLVEYGYRDELKTGTPTGGEFVLENAEQVIGEGHLAIGSGLFDWVARKRTLGGFGVTLRWNPSPCDSSGNPVPCVGRAVCRVEWQSHRGDEKGLELSRVMTH